MTANIFEIFLGYSGTTPIVDTWGTLGDGYLEITVSEANPDYPGFAQPMYYNYDHVIWTR